MKKTLLLGSMFVLVLSLPGCGSSSPDSLVKEQISCMNELADALEKNEPEDKLTEIKNRMEATNKKLEALKLSDEDKKKLLEKHKDESTKAMTRFMQAMGKNPKAFGRLFGGNLPGMPQPPQSPQRK